jgi:hypothetical protein
LICWWISLASIICAIAGPRIDFLPGTLDLIVGTDRPVGTPEGDLHALTQLFHEAATGETPSKDQSGLKAARSALAWRKPIST